MESSDAVVVMVPPLAFTVEENVPVVPESAPNEPLPVVVSVCAPRLTEAFAPEYGTYVPRSPVAVVSRES